MKASDFTTTSSQRDAASQTLLQTEQTDAVNSGLVGKADKSGSALKGNLYSVGKKAATGGAASAALSAVTKGRKDASSAEPSSASDDAASDGDGGTVVSPKGGRSKGRSAQTGSSAGTASSTSSGMAAKGGRFGESLKAGAKRAGKGAVLGAAARKTLEGTELEGADDLYYKGKGAYRIARGVKRRLSGKDAMQADKPLGQLSEKKSSMKAANTVEAKRKAQSTSYFKRSVYTTATNTKSAAATSKFGAKSVAAKGSASPGILAAAAPLFIVIFLFAILSISILGVVGGGDENKSNSLEGMPKWVTYELVLACLEAHENYGYPASALLGQMMIENGTDDDGSELGRVYHNYGGIKYFGTIPGVITGSVSMKTWEVAADGTRYQVFANFAVFASDDAFMRYRCENLYRQPNYTSVPNYHKAIETNDSELFLRALGEGGYYTEPQDNYIALYRSICQSYPLVAALDSMTAEEFKNSYGGSGEEYASASEAQRAVADQAKVEPPTKAGACAEWVNNVYEHAGFPRPSGNACCHYLNYCHSSDRSELKVGMMVAVQESPTSYGNANYGHLGYGHVGIYIGDGKVMHCTGSVQTDSIDDWISDYATRHEARWGFPPGVSD